MINFGHETEELEFKRSTGEVHDAMKDVVAILNKHEKGLNIRALEIKKALYLPARLILHAMVYADKVK